MIEGYPLYPAAPAIQKAWPPAATVILPDGRGYFTIPTNDGQVEFLEDVWVPLDELPIEDPQPPAEFAVTPAYRLPAGNVAQGFAASLYYAYQGTYWNEPITNPVFTASTFWEANDQAWWYDGKTYLRRGYAFDFLEHSGFYQLSNVGGGGNSFTYTARNLVEPIITHVITEDPSFPGTMRNSYHSIWNIEEILEASWWYTGYVPSGRKIGGIVPLLLPLLLLTCVLPLTCLLPTLSISNPPNNNTPSRRWRK